MRLLLSLYLHHALICHQIPGVPAAGLLTPADVIKTRLQVMARRGQATYSGIADCALKIMRMEGPRAFWKGALGMFITFQPPRALIVILYSLMQHEYSGPLLSLVSRC